LRKNNKLTARQIVKMKILVILIITISSGLAFDESAYYELSREEITQALSFAIACKATAPTGFHFVGVFADPILVRAYRFRHEEFICDIPTWVSNTTEAFEWMVMTHRREKAN
jgi:hypothetical protein